MHIWQKIWEILSANVFESSDILFGYIFGFNSILDAVYYVVSDKRFVIGLYKLVFPWCFRIFLGIMYTFEPPIFLDVLTEKDRGLKSHIKG